MIRAPKRLRRAAAFVLAGLTAAAPAAAVTVQGITFPDQRSVGDRTLQLSGAGLRNKAFVDLYAAGLYLEQPTSSAQEVIGSEQTKRVELHILRDLTKQQVAGTIAEAFVRNSGASMPALQQRLDRLVAAIPAVKRGDVLTVTSIPGRGVVVEGAGMQPVTIEGEDFSRALFSVWLGERPVEAELKSALLGRRTSPGS